MSRYASHSRQKVACDLLHTRVRPLRSNISFRMLITWRFTQSIAPPNGRGIEDKVLLGPWINRGGVSAAIWFARRGERGTGGHHFEPGNRRGITVPFPADQA